MRVNIKYFRVKKYTTLINLSHRNIENLVAKNKLLTAKNENFEAEER